MRAPEVSTSRHREQTRWFPHDDEKRVFVDDSRVAAHSRARRVRQIADVLGRHFAGRIRSRSVFVPHFPSLERRSSEPACEAQMFEMIDETHGSLCDGALSRRNTVTVKTTRAEAHGDRILDSGFSGYPA